MASAKWSVWPLLLLAISRLTFCTLTSRLVPVDEAIKGPSYTGQTFGERVYPSDSELLTMPLRDLFRLRPTNRRGEEPRHFAFLFANHPKIKAIDPYELDSQQLIKRWTEIWSEESTGPHAKKLPHSIMDHLLNDKRLSKELVDLILKRCRRNKDRLAQFKMRQRIRYSDDPLERAKRMQSLARLKVYNTRRRRGNEAYEKGNAVAFEKMLKYYDISVQLPAIEMERQSRCFKDAINGAQQTSFAFRHFLKQRNSAEDGIQSALQNRKVHNYRDLRARMDERQKLKRHIRKDSRLESGCSTSFGHEEENGLAVACGADESRNSFQILARQARWWKA